MHEGVVLNDLDHGLRLEAVTDVEAASKVDLAHGAKTAIHDCALALEFLARGHLLGGADLDLDVFLEILIHYLYRLPETAVVVLGNVFLSV